MFYLEGKTILRVAEKAAHFQFARWLSDMSSETIWKTFRMLWIDVYFGLSDIVVYDVGKDFLGSAFQANTDMLHIRTRSVQTKSANSISVVEHYHAHVRRAYRIIKGKAPDLDNEATKQATVKSGRSWVGPDGLVPTLLVFGAISCFELPSDRPPPSFLNEAPALRSSTT